MFLASGRALPSDGVYTQVGSRMVFVLPIGHADGKPVLQLVSLPTSAVDLARTTRYTEGVRTREYALTRGPSDYSALLADVSLALAEIDREPDRQKQQALAADLRSRVAAWPAAHFNYRLADVRTLLADVDQATSELGGTPHREPLQLAPASEPALPRPSSAESVELARLAAEVADDPVTRAAILKAIALVATVPSAPSPPVAVTARDSTTGAGRVVATTPSRPAAAPVNSKMPAPPTIPSAPTPMPIAAAAAEHDALTTSAPPVRATAPAPAVVASPAALTTKSRSRGRWPLAAAAVVLGAIGAWWWRRRMPAAPAPVAESAPAPEPAIAPPAAAETRAVRHAEDVLEVGHVVDAQRGGYRILEGELKNVSDRLLHEVEAIVEWQTARGELVARERAFIAHQALAPGAASEFKIVTKSSPALASYSLQFQAEGAVLARCASARAS